MRELYLFYTIKDFAPNVWYSSGSGEKYLPDQLPIRIDGCVRFKWDSVIVFLPASAAAGMAEGGGYDVCFGVSSMNLTLRSLSNSRPVQFASYYAMLQHMHALIVDQRYTVSSVTKDSLFLRAAPKRRSSWAWCWGAPVGRSGSSNRVADVSGVSLMSRYHPPELRRTLSGRAVLSNRDGQAPYRIKRLPS
jgi:hypothetical protein